MDSKSSAFFVFFFQAEDGIRDRNVTGVQTCALPILCLLGLRTPFGYTRQPEDPGGTAGCSKIAFSRRNRSTTATRTRSATRSPTPCSRSEERRVGKECGRERAR